MGYTPGSADDWIEPDCEGLDDDTALAVLRESSEAEMGPIEKGAEAAWRLGLGHRIPQAPKRFRSEPVSRLNFYRGFVRGRESLIRYRRIRAGMDATPDPIESRSVCRARAKRGAVSRVQRTDLGRCSKATGQRSGVRHVTGLLPLR